MPLKHWQAQDIDHLSRKTAPVFNYPLAEEIFPSVKSEPPQTQFWTISTCHGTGNQGEEIQTSLSTSPPQEAVESNEVTPQPFLQTKKCRSPQPLLIGYYFPPLHRFCRPPLDTFKYLNILFKFWGPKLQTVLKVLFGNCLIVKFGNFQSNSITLAVGLF